MKHFIIGTAGHVDHGKTTLIGALTGTATDRLPEEKERGLSIDLGFANLKLGQEISAGIIDVPGHQRFLKNMLAGVGGFDLGLLVVDAQEGVMPQTREHVEILSLLKTKAGLAVLTKTDLVDPELLELAVEELKDFLAGTYLEGCNVVPVSGETKEGIPELKRALAEILDSVEPRDLDQPFRLPVDRAFTLTGFGSVVTGSLWSGRLKVGDPVEVLPEGLRTRIRGLQVHGESVEEAVAGQRVAVNLTGLALSDLHRGQVLAPPDLMRPTERVDVSVESLESLPRPLKHRAPVRFYAGTAERLGRILLLEDQLLKPGSTGLAQIELQTPLALRRNDRFILRNFSAQHTVGGGSVLDPNAERHRRSDRDALETLKRRAEGGVEQAILAQLSGSAAGQKTVSKLASDLQMEQQELEALLMQLQEAGEVTFLGKAVALAPLTKHLEDRLSRLMSDLHESAPWKVGWKKEELLKLLASDKTQLAASVLQQAVRDGDLKDRGGLIAKAEARPRLNQGQQEIADKVIQHLKAAVFKPTEWSKLEEELGLPKKIWQLVGTHLRETGRVVLLEQNLPFLEEMLEEGRRRLSQLEQPFAASEAREALDTSRKFVIPLLEFYDQTGFTQRVDDKRVIRQPVTKSRADGT